MGLIVEFLQSAFSFTKSLQMELKAVDRERKTGENS